jgi:hypothetical protein
MKKKIIFNIFLLSMSSICFSQIEQFDINKILYLTNTEQINVIINYTNTTNKTQTLEIRKGEILEPCDLSTQKQSLVICDITDDFAIYNNDYSRWFIKVNALKTINLHLICYCKDNGFSYKVGDSLVYANARVINYDYMCVSQLNTWTPPEVKKNTESEDITFTCKSNESFEDAIIKAVKYEYKKLLERKGDENTDVIINNTVVIVVVDEETGIITGDIEIKSRGNDHPADHIIQFLEKIDVKTPYDQGEYRYEIKFIGDIIDADLYK